MKESIGTGLSWIKSNAYKLGLIKEAAVRVVNGPSEVDKIF